MAVETKYVHISEDGMRLDRWFRIHYPNLKHGQLQKIVRTGQVRVDGGRAKTNDRLEKGQAIRIPPLKEDEAAPEKKETAILSPQDRSLLKQMTLYEDADVWVLNKPQGLASQGGTRMTRHLDGMLAALEPELGDRPRLVHRLDKETSGVIVVAKKRTVAATLGKMFSTRSVRKIYWALVKGVPKPAQGLIEVPLIKATMPEGDRVRAALPTDKKEDVQKAVTRYAVVDNAGHKLAWMSLKPVTGRQHQLRAHMDIIGCPIVGDDKYGADKPMVWDGIKNTLHLHARRVTFSHPVTRKQIDVTAPLPPHMAASFEELGFELSEGQQYDDHE